MLEIRRNNMCEKTKEITNDTSGIILRTAMSAIPGLAPLASFWSELNSIKSTKRLNLLSNSIGSLSSCYSKELDLIKDDISNHEERITILETIAEKVVKEWNEEKIKLYAQIAINDFITLEPLDTKIAIINCFSELTMDDINLLKQMSMFEDTIQVINLSKTLDTLILM